MFVNDSAERIRQGDVLAMLDQTFTTNDTRIQLPYVVVITQDCELEQDYNSRASNPVKHSNIIDSILLAPAFTADQVRLGIHLSDAGMNMSPFGKVDSTAWTSLVNNTNPRYHHIKSNIDKQTPDLVIDFKRIYTIERAELYTSYDQCFVMSLAILHRELLSQRFAAFLSRVALPVPEPIS